MTGFATLDTGQDFKKGDSKHEGNTLFKPIDIPPGWHLSTGFAQSDNGPGVMATISRPHKRWLSKLSKEAKLEARTDAVADALEDDSTIDDILQMLDVSDLSTRSNAPVIIFIWNLIFHLIHN